MENQKAIKDFNYQFKGNINAPLFTTAIVFVLPIFVGFLIFSLSLESAIGKFISVALFFTFLILFIIKFSSDSNLILFDTDAIIHFNKKVVQTFSYSELHKIQISKPTKGLPIVYFKIKGKDFSVKLDKKNHANFTYEEFAEYLLKIKATILIIESNAGTEYKYGIVNGAFTKIKIVR